MANDKVIEKIAKLPTLSADIARQILIEVNESDAKTLPIFDLIPATVSADFSLIVNQFNYPFV